MAGTPVVAVVTYGQQFMSSCFEWVFRRRDRRRSGASRDGGADDGFDDGDAHAELLKVQPATKAESRQVEQFQTVLQQLVVDIAQVESIIDSYKEIATRCVAVLRAPTSAGSQTGSPNDMDQAALKKSAAGTLPGIMTTLNTWCGLQSRNRQLHASLVAYLRSAHARVFIERLSSNLLTLNKFTSDVRASAPHEIAEDQLDAVEDMAEGIEVLARPVDIPTGVRIEAEIDPGDFHPDRVLDGLIGVHKELYDILGIHAPGAAAAVERGAKADARTRHQAVAPSSSTTAAGPGRKRPGAPASGTGVIDADVAALEQLLA